jgi:hypothetical protein
MGLRKGQARLDHLSRSSRPLHLELTRSSQITLGSKDSSSIGPTQILFSAPVLNRDI